MKFAPGLGFISDRYWLSAIIQSHWLADFFPWPINLDEPDPSAITTDMTLTPLLQSDEDYFEGSDSLPQVNMKEVCADG